MNSYHCYSSFNWQSWQHVAFRITLSVLEHYAGRIGSQKYTINDKVLPVIRFGVYAPNARKVEVVFARLWNINDPKRTQIDRHHPAPLHKIAGGYIADDGFGIDSDKPAFDLKIDGNGCWFSDPNDPRLANFSDWVHVPYMYRVTEDSGTVAYRSDLYSRCQLSFGDFDPKGKHYEGPIFILPGRKVVLLSPVPIAFLILLGRHRMKTDNRFIYFRRPVI